MYRGVGYDTLWITTLSIGVVSARGYMGSGFLCLILISEFQPNLNLIERLWKFVKKKCLYSKYYPDFTSFKDSISDCLGKTNTVYK